MRILVIQLARFGDIFQTWAPIRALQRLHPEAQIDCLVRERYKAAIFNHPDVKNVIVFDTPKVMAPLLFQADGIDMSLAELQKFIEPLSGQYDRIINLTFSPFSSYLADAIAKPNSVVTGYTRTSDGYLRMPDDASAYFYAQVGVDRASRLHLVDVFALVAGVDLRPSDFDFQLQTDPKWLPHRIVVHVGGSQKQKVCTKEVWTELIQRLSKEFSGTIYLVGGPSEALGVQAFGDNVVDLCGKTTISELMTLVCEAELLIACDSMLIQIANYTKTKVLNLSFPAVRFWETGPRNLGSRVLIYPHPSQVDVQQVVEESQALLTGNPTLHDGYTAVGAQGVIYQGPSESATYEFEWKLIEAVCMGKEFPPTDRELIISAFTRLHEVASLGLDQIDNLMKGKSPQISGSILDQIDMIMHTICDFCPEVSPLIRWFLCEKARIAPGTTEAVGQATQKIFMQLFEVTRLYALSADMVEQRTGKELTWK